MTLPNGLPPILISHHSGMPDELFAELEAELASLGVEPVRKSREPSMYASVDWIPAVIVLAIARPFVDAFLKRAADDVADAYYPRLKTAVSKFVSRVFRSGARAMTIGKGSREPTPDPTGLFAIDIQVAERVIYKFIFEEGSSAERYERQVFTALDLVRDLGVVHVEDPNGRVQRLVCQYDDATDTWAIVDPVTLAIEKARREGRILGE
jgi:hypothetical protein